MDHSGVPLSNFAHSQFQRISVRRVPTTLHTSGTGTPVTPIEEAMIQSTPISTTSAATFSDPSDDNGNDDTIDLCIGENEPLKPQQTFVTHGENARSNSLPLGDIKRQKSEIDDASDAEGDGRPRGYINDTNTMKTNKPVQCKWVVIILLFALLLTSVAVTLLLVFTNDSMAHSVGIQITPNPNITTDYSVPPTVNPTSAPSTNPSVEPTNEPTLEPTIDVLPQPGIAFEYIYQNRTQNMTLNPNVTYFKPDTTLECIVEFNEEGQLDANVSYIQILDDFAHTVRVDTILVATAPIFATLHTNCTLVPAVVVTDIINDTENGILTLKIKEADMFDYIDELDCNISNATLIDSGIDVGEIQKLKHLAQYFGNETIETNENGSWTKMIFRNVSYTELESICYNVSENGTIINTIPMVNGICDGLSTVDYFGQQYGMDTIQFGQHVFNASDTNYSVESSHPNRRRLRRRRARRFFKRIAKVVKKVVKKVVEFVDDLISILKGDINKRILDSALSIDASKTYTVSGAEDVFVRLDSGGVRGHIGGTFDINSGVEFYSTIHCDLTAKYKIFSKNPSFDMFRLVLGGSTRFKSYVDILVDGTVNIGIEVARVEKRQVLWLGPVPIVIRPYASVSFGVESSMFLDFALEFGYKPTEFEYGIEWNKEDDEWNTIRSPLVFEPYKNFGSQMDEDQSCLYFSIEPYVEIKIGIIFYEILDVSIIPTISLVSEFQYPSTCDANVERCEYDPLQASFGIEFQFNVYIGLEVGLLAPELDAIVNLPSIVKLYKLPFNIPSVKLFETCFETNIDAFALIGDSCCDVTPTKSPTIAPQSDNVSGNKLCDTDAWNIIKGNWHQTDDTECSWANTNSAAGNMLWFGTSDGLYYDPNYSHHSFTIEATLELFGTSGDAGITFRAQKVSHINDGGQMYYIGLYPSNNKIVFGKMDDSWAALHVGSYVVNANVLYTLRVEAFGDIYNLYVNGDMIFENVIRSEYSIGSIGLRTFYLPTTYYSLNYFA